MIIEMVGVEVDRSKIIRQNLAPVKGACGPATFLNALRFGPPEFQNIFAGIPGDSDGEKLKFIIDTHGSAPSASISGGRLFGYYGGVWPDDVRKFFGSILGDQTTKLGWTYFDVMNAEPPAAHLWRIHSLLVCSLAQGVPVIACVSAYTAGKQEDEKSAWKRISGHFILIARVAKRLSDDAQGFIFQFVEPSAGKLREGYIYSETVRPFRANKESCVGYVYNKTDNSFEPLKGSHQTQWIENGFLQVVAPSLRLQTQKEPWHVRTFMALQFGFGRFTEAPYGETDSVS